MDFKLFLVVAVFACVVVDSDGGIFRRRFWRRIRWGFQFGFTFKSGNKSEIAAVQEMFKDTECNKWEAIERKDDLIEKEEEIGDEKCNDRCKGCPISGEGCEKCPTHLCRCGDDEKEIFEKIAKKKMEEWEKAREEKEKGIIEEIEESEKETEKKLMEWEEEKDEEEKDMIEGLEEIAEEIEKEKDEEEKKEMEDEEEED